MFLPTQFRGCQCDVVLVSSPLASCTTQPRGATVVHPNLLEEATTIPLTMAVILQVNLFPNFLMYLCICLSI